MIENRAFKMDDYLAMLQRRLKLILIPALLTPVVGFLVSYAFLPKYTASSLILVAGQKVPEGYAKPLATQDFVQLIAAMQEQVLSRAHMVPMIDRMGLAKDKSADAVIEDIRAQSLHRTCTSGCRRGEQSRERQCRPKQRISHYCELYC